MAVDSKEAHAYLIDPFTGPDPSDDTGPNAHFRSTFAPTSPLPSPPNSATTAAAPPAPASPGKVETNPFRRSASLRSPTKDSPRVSQRSYPSPPNSASPRRSDFPPTSSHRSAAFSSYNPPTTTTTSEEPTSRARRNSSHIARSPQNQQQSGLPTRGHSLRSRYPGDHTHQPLKMLSAEAAAAHRSPHLRKSHLPAADTIDQLDASGALGLAYHHEGPYDAALPARNTRWQTSPVAAVQGSNLEALKATPRERIVDSIERGVPLSGVASVPPGETDRMGRRYEYEEGENMMIADGGDYKRWPGIDYAPGDTKGKGEPSYSVEKTLKQQGGAEEDIEMTTHASGINRHESIGKRAAEGIKRRIGSLRRKEKA